jgi:hypothetical protein
MKRKKRKAPFMHYAAVLGCVSTGIVYAAIGLVAILSFLQIKDGGADEASLLVYLDKYFVGRIVIWVVLLGMLGYIVWRIYETVYDPYQYGNGKVGLVKRAGAVMS